MKKYNVDDIIKMIESRDEALCDILPEICRLRGIEQEREHHPEGDVFEHTRLVVKRIPKHASDLVKWAAIFHDIGKFDVARKKKGRWVFYDHEKVSAKKVKELGRRLGISDNSIEKIYWLVKEHMKLHRGLEMRDKKVIDLYNRMKDLGIWKDYLLLGYADAMGSNKNLTGIKGIIKRVNELKKKGVLK